MNKNAIRADGGYRSRKMVMAYIVLALIVAGFLLTGKYPSLAVTFPEYCMGLLGATSVYAGSNAAIKWAAMRNSQNIQQPLEPENPNL